MPMNLSNIYHHFNLQSDERITNALSERRKVVINHLKSELAMN